MASFPRDHVHDGEMRAQAANRKRMNGRVRFFRVQRTGPVNLRKKCGKGNYLRGCVCVWKEGGREGISVVGRVEAVTLRVSCTTQRGGAGERRQSGFKGERKDDGTVKSGIPHTTIPLPFKPTWGPSLKTQRAPCETAQRACVCRTRKGEKYI